MKETLAYVRWYNRILDRTLNGQLEILEDLDKAIDKGLFEVKLRLKDTGSETFNAICTYYVGTAYWFDKKF